MYNKLGMLNHILPVLSPADIVSTATTTAQVKVSGHHTQFLVYLGTLTGDSLNVTVEASTGASTTGAEAIPFVYRLSGTSDTWGDVTTCDSTGADFTASNDDCIMLVEVDHQSMNSDDQYLAVLLSPGASASATEVAVIAIQDSWYPSVNHTT